MKTWVKALLIGTVAVAPTIALAAIDSTHHDINYLGKSSGEKCAYCHSKTGLTAGASGLGKVGQFCVQVCHITGSGLAGAGVPDVVPTQAGYMTAYANGTATITGNGVQTVNVLSDGHGMIPYNLASIRASEASSFTSTGWPYANSTANGDTMQCTTCHAVHDATNPPFLNAKLSVGTQSGGFCQKCHSWAGRQQAFTDSGNHPIEFKWDPAAAVLRGAGKTGDTATVMNKRDIQVPTNGGNILNVAATGVANGAGATALNALTAHWNLGGHVLSNTTGLPTNGASATATEDQLSCVSCHTVHVTNSASNGYGKLLLVSNDLNIACFACHTNEPGASNYGHPIFPEVTNTSSHGWPSIPLNANYNALPAYYKPGTGSPTCVGCHDVHGGFNNRMAIRDINNAGAMTAMAAGASACELCHLSSFANPTAANGHHPGAASTTYATTYGFPTSLGWLTTDGLGDLNDGLTCPDCHVGDGTTTKRATAHNWK